MDFPKAAQLVLISLLGLFCLLGLLSSIFALWIVQKRCYSQRIRIAIWCLALANTVALMVNTVKWLKTGQFILEFWGASPLIDALQIHSF